MVFRHSPLDAVLVGAAVAVGGFGMLLFARGGPLAAAVAVAASVWWCSNTIAHNHLHNPLFNSRTANRLFSLYLTLLTSVPQTIWRARHLWHHAGEPVSRRRVSLGAAGMSEVALVAASWAAMAALAPRLFLTIYIPGYLCGLALCQIQGHFEHAGRASAVAGVSFYGRLWNLAWFNDGYHAEHHRRPGEHWSRLSAAHMSGAEVSSFPPIARFLDGDLAAFANRILAHALVALERVALALPGMQRWLVDRHAHALASLLPALEGRPLARIAVVGGGLFPRTVLVLERLLPSSSITVIDASGENIACARRYLDQRPPGPRRGALADRVEEGPPSAAIHFVEQRFDAESAAPFDLVILPLGFLGDRAELYRAPAAPALLIHDWAWRTRGHAGALVSLWLFKRLNLVLR